MGRQHQLLVAIGLAWCFSIVLAYFGATNVYLVAAAILVSIISFASLWSLLNTDKHHALIIKNATEATSSNDI